MDVELSIVGAGRCGGRPVRPLCSRQQELREGAGKEKWPHQEPPLDKDRYATIESICRAGLEEANRITDKTERSNRLEQIRGPGRGNASAQRRLSAQCT